MDDLKNKKILLGVSGGIAAYKACEVTRRLTERGAEVRVVLTKAAEKFVTALSFQALSQHPVHSDLFNLTEESEMGHIKLADEADLFLIAPATADVLAKLATGLADDLLTTAALVTRAPLLFAPSMNVNMWEKEVVQENIRKLQSRGCQMIEPAEGYLACGWEGKGRLAEPETIVAAVVERLRGPFGSSKKKTLAGKKVLINAGPTREYLDPVRYISNPSSGKMGFALAAAARRRGAEVTLIAGPVALPTPEGVQRIDVVSAEEMFKACRKAFPSCNLFIASAAVGDYTPTLKLDKKMKKADQKLSLDLKPSLDILRSLGAEKKKGQVLIGFAAETDKLRHYAQEKLKKKNLDLIVANDVSRNDVGFSSDSNQVTLFFRQGKPKSLAKMPKREVAEAILEEAEALLSLPTQGLKLLKSARR
ncbi:MAG TPA: bifunctional phosphopantothenoylcysteine decarboxylase/phosphopantothenate--cysteine ligase CoaBC [bacterium]|nr:bifunctional phosphopantothenoylcysteine decarboxylase/phosphopantothenate--cysteine ligase CoaBC [bacterium]